MTKLFWSYTEKKSPSKDGIIPRNIQSKTEKFYHLRSFLIKYPKNSFMKGIFPWLSNALFNFIGSTKIGKGSTLEESVGNEKFAEIGENCYIGVNSTLATHLVEGIFGNIAYFKINVGNNVTLAGTNQIGPGTEIRDNSYLLPLASATKHSILKGNNYYFGIPLRRIFNKKVMRYLDLKPEELQKNENIDQFLENNSKEKLKKEKSEIEFKQASNNNEQIIEKPVDITKLTEKDLAVDFTTSSAISRVNIKFLAVYLPIFWLCGLVVGILFYTYAFFLENIILFIYFLPTMILALWFVFILCCFLFSKLLLILVNLIHKPKEGIFLAEIGDTDFEFWCLRTELKKIVLWLMRNCPIPWIDVLAFRWFGINIDFSSYLYDAWCDAEFVDFGRRVVIGQGATIMSSMVVGKYLIIKRVFFDDYVLVGGHTTVAPGTIVGKDTILAAISTTLYDQYLEPGWIYIGIPVIKLKPNKYAELRRKIIIKKDVDAEKKFEIEHEINIDEDKKDIA
jgi:acetyltransferase-like isoleucine patch superfamily enzyme